MQNAKVTQVWAPSLITAISLAALDRSSAQGLPTATPVAEAAVGSERFTPSMEDPGGYGPPPITVVTRGRYIGESKLGAGDARASLYSAGVQARIPWALGEKLTATFEAGGDDWRFDFKRFGDFLSGKASPLKNVAEVKLSPGLMYRYSEKWAFFAGAQWGVASGDGVKAAASSVWGGGAGAIYQVRDDLTLTLGAAATTRLGYARAFAPFFGVDWRINPSWTLSLGGDPVDYLSPSLRIAYRLDSRWTFFGTGGLDEHYFRLADDSSIPGGTLRYRSGEVNLGVDYHITPRYLLTIYGGAQVAQDFRFENHQRGVVAKDRTGTSPMAGVRLSVSF